MCWKSAKTVTFWTKRKVTKKDGDLKICPQVGQIDPVSFETEKKVKLKDSEYKNSSNICERCAKTAWNVTFWTKKKVKEKDSHLKINSPVGQIDRKNRKKKIQLLLRSTIIRL